MRWRRKIRRLGEPSASRRALYAVAIAVSASACRSTTEIVLVIDTNLAVPTDIDHIDVSITGSDMQSTPVSIDLTALPAGTQFPLTLGLTPAGAPGPVSVSVVGRLQTAPVVQQDATTAFVDGSTRMLEMLLLDACLGVTCPTDQTCGSSGCAPIAIAAASLPPWTGPPPPLSVAGTATPIDGRTVWAGGWHSCANDGSTLYCWGQNSDGELGDNSTINTEVRRPVINLPDPASVGLGQLVSCICDKSGGAWCWGRNIEGELGLGHTSTSSTVPIQVPGITDCLRIAGGGKHTCMVHLDGTVSCWGSNAYGQVGQPSSSLPVATAPMTVAGLSGVTVVQGGDSYTCALTSGMTVSCWGDNDSGQLGDGTTTVRSTPAAVVGLGSDIVELAVGRKFACGRHATGQVSCWGSNPTGQLGNGLTANSSVPVDAIGIEDAIQVGAGLDHVCVLRKANTMSCWGANSSGQLGNGTTVNSLTPVDVLDISQVTSIAVGSVHTCARHAGGVACWGENLVDQLGDGTNNNRSSPVSVAGFL